MNDSLTDIREDVSEFGNMKEHELYRTEKEAQKKITEICLTIFWILVAY